LALPFQVDALTIEDLPSAIRRRTSDQSLEFEDGILASPVTLKRLTGESASQVHVSKSGNNSTADGSPALPFLTIAATTTAGLPSDAVMVISPGYYGEDVIINDANFPSGDHLTIMGFGGVTRIRSLQVIVSRSVTIQLINLQISQPSAVASPTIYLDDPGASNILTLVLKNVSVKGNNSQAAIATDTIVSGDILVYADGSDVEQLGIGVAVELNDRARFQGNNSLLYCQTNHVFQLNDSGSVYLNNCPEVTAAGATGFHIVNSSGGSGIVYLAGCHVNPSLTSGRLLEGSFSYAVVDGVLISNNAPGDINMVGILSIGVFSRRNGSSPSITATTVHLLTKAALVQYTPTLPLTSNDVQAAIDELAAITENVVNGEKTKAGITNCVAGDATVSLSVGPYTPFPIGATICVVAVSVGTQANVNVWVESITPSGWTLRVGDGSYSGPVHWAAFRIS